MSVECLIETFVFECPFSSHHIFVICSFLPAFYTYSYLNSKISLKAHFNMCVTSLYKNNHAMLF